MNPRLHVQNPVVTARAKGASSAKQANDVTDSRVHGETTRLFETKAVDIEAFWMDGMTQDSGGLERLPRLPSPSVANEFGEG